MSQFINYSGNGDLYLGGFMPLSRNGDVFFSCKRARINAPLAPFNGGFIQKKQTSLDVLPDECLFEVFRRLPGGQERSACAFVSKRWLSLLSSIQVNERQKGNAAPEETEIDEGFLTRSLEGKKATDVRLAAIAVGTSSRGGLGKLIIRGSHPTRGVTDQGLKAISRGCPSLKALSLWNVPTIGDEGLIEIAMGCHQLEKLDLSQCPMITDKALIAIARFCPKLASLNVDSCPNIRNMGLEAVGESCRNLKMVSIKDCPLVGDQGITALVSSLSNVVTTVKLHGLNITDASLAAIGYYGRSVTDLVLSSLQNVSEKGFWCMGCGNGLQMLKTLTVQSCKVTDLGLETIAKGCPNLKTFCLQKSAFVSDNGLVSFSRAAGSLESLQLDECHRITQLGFFGLLLNCGNKLKSISVSSCLGIKDMPVGVTLPKPAHTSLRSLTIRNCPLFGDVNLALLSTGFCFELKSLELSGLEGISDHGATPLIKSSDAGLETVNLSGCANITDETVSALTRAHGGTLELINLKGCRKVTDISLRLIANDCFLLGELDVTRCSITDAGVGILSRSKQILGFLQILSMAGCTLLSDRCLPSLAKLGSSLDGLNLLNCTGISRRVLEKLEEKLWNCDILS